MHQLSFGELDERSRGKALGKRKTPDTALSMPNPAQNGRKGPLSRWGSGELPPCVLDWVKGVGRQTP